MTTALGALAAALLAGCGGGSRSATAEPNEPAEPASAIGEQGAQSADPTAPRSSCRPARWPPRRRSASPPIPAARRHCPLRSRAWARSTPSPRTAATSPSRSRCASRGDGHAGAERDAPRARHEALAALALADEGRCDAWLPPAELWLHAARALAAAGDAQARAVLERGRRWVLDVAARQVPQPFRDGFLHRNPVNRQLLALAASRAPASSAAR